MNRFLPLGAIIVYIGVAGVWRAWIQHRRYGTWGIAVFRSSPRRALLDGLLLAIPGVLLCQAAVQAGRPERLERLFIAPARETLGAAVAAIGITLTVLAQLDLGASWRIGIDPAARPGLVDRGLFRFSRNPIYVAVLTSLIGFGLMMPTWLTVLSVSAGVVAIRWQVTEEETYLARTYGDAYLAYGRRVGRFVPWLGRFRDRAPSGDGD